MRLRGALIHLSRFPAAEANAISEDTETLRLSPVGAEFVVPGTEHVVPGAEHVVPGAEHVVRSTEHVVPGAGHLVPGAEQRPGVCERSCEELSSMVSELSGLRVIVNQLHENLHKVVGASAAAPGATPAARQAVRGLRGLCRGAVRAQLGARGRDGDRVSSGGRPGRVASAVTGVTQAEASSVAGRVAAEPET